MLPIKDALMKIAEVDGSDRNAFNNLLPIMEHLDIHTLITLLNSGSSEWSAIESAAILMREQDTALRLKAAIISLGPKLMQLRADGKPVPIDPDGIGMSHLSMSLTLSC